VGIDATAGAGVIIDGGWVAHPTDKTKPAAIKIGVFIGGQSIARSDRDAELHRQVAPKRSLPARISIFHGDPR
jgi:hypothetical protein